MEASAVRDLRAVRSAMETEARTALLAAAAKVLSNEGPSALTLRRVAETVNASTKMIYTHFGGKDGLLDAIYLHSFAGLTRSFENEMGEADAHARLMRMVDAYRRYALAEPALYSVMFGDLGRAWEAPQASRREAWRSFATLRDTVAACLPPGTADDPSSVTYLLWSAMHGVVSLELRKLLGPDSNGRQLFHLAVDAVCLTHDLRRTTHQP